MVRYCSPCGVERLFEQPPCADTHRGDCPEYACVTCGYAVLVGPWPIEVEMAVEIRKVA
jgi:hypothetical protein